MVFPDFLMEDKKRHQGLFFVLVRYFYMFDFKDNDVNYSGICDIDFKNNDELNIFFNNHIESYDYMVLNNYNFKAVIKIIMLFFLRN